MEIQYLLTSEDFGLVEIIGVDVFEIYSVYTLVYFVTEVQMICLQIIRKILSFPKSLNDV